MPELPEVQTVVDTLRPRVLNRIIRAIELSRTDIVHPAAFDLAASLTGRTIAAIARRGKRIVISLDDGNRFYVHLGMTGRLTIEPSANAIEKHTHLIAKLDEGEVSLRFRDPRRFGGIFWLSSSGQSGDLGPEPLKLRPVQLARLLRGTTRAIKSALLDQRLIAGLGNIYVDEALFVAGIHPLTRARALSAEQVRRLNRAIKGTLRRAIRYRGSTLRDYVDGNGASGAFQLRHCVYDREGEPCRTCKMSIRRIVLGRRSTHFCPRCQRRSMKCAR
jgi:formamidopyrimidine-DNA glycosylase